MRSVYVLIAALLTAPGVAQARIVLLEEAVEASYMVITMDTDVTGQVRAAECSNCKAKVLIVTAKTKFIKKKKKLSVTKELTGNYGGGLVIYDPKTFNAISVEMY
ncbi:MAG: hypothetical protein HY940_01030 [Gammaproteobacteria bacterium]|nr:hypothetical protein [Gammaproteobacteria bacterium]